jgi:hypothetical protein
MSPQSVEPPTIDGGRRRRENERPAEADSRFFLHCPAYDDWSFPKGNLHDGEAREAAAVREVEEETGPRCRLGPEAGKIRWVSLAEAPRTVSYDRDRRLVAAFDSKE